MLDAALSPKAIRWQCVIVLGRQVADKRDGRGLLPRM